MDEIAVRNKSALTEQFEAVKLYMGRGGDVIQISIGETGNPKRRFL
jgi:hypothetical protein